MTYVMKEREAIEKGIDIKALKAEQKKLAKSVSLKDAFDFNLATRFCAVHTYTLQKTKELLASAVILDENLELIEEKYVIRPVKFPYIPSYRAYRELPVMLAVYNKLEEQPDVIFIEAHGIAHPRGLGLASHFGISLQKPTIGITKKILIGEQKNGEVVFNNKTVARAVITKQGSNPIYISSGHMISLDTAVKITKKCVKEPHKLPEPIVKTKRYLDSIAKVLNRQQNLN